MIILTKALFLVISSSTCFWISLTQRRAILLHYVKYQIFSQIPGVEILCKGTVSDTNSAETVPLHKFSIPIRLKFGILRNLNWKPPKFRNQDEILIYGFSQYLWTRNPQTFSINKNLIAIKVPLSFGLKFILVFNDI